MAEAVKTGEEIHTSDCKVHPAYDAVIDIKELKGGLQNTDIYPLYDTKWIIGALQLVNRTNFGVIPEQEGCSVVQPLIHICSIALKQASLNEREKVARTGSQVFLQISKVSQRREVKADKKAQIFLEFSQRLNEELDSQQVIQKVFFLFGFCFVFFLLGLGSDCPTHSPSALERSAVVL